MFSVATAEPFHDQIADDTTGRNRDTAVLDRPTNRGQPPCTRAAAADISFTHREPTASAREHAGRLVQLEALIQRQLTRRVAQFRIRYQDGGLILEGRTRTYYGKQLVQHAVMDATDLPILANNIVVG